MLASLKALHPSGLLCTLVAGATKESLLSWSWKCLDKMYS